MRRSSISCLILLIGLALGLGSSARAGASPATLLEVEAEGKVLAKPDMATLVFEVNTQSPQAQAAAQENARLSARLLAALKKTLGAEEKVQSLGYRLTPVTSYQEKLRRTEITGYRTENRFRVKLKDLNRLGQVIDTGLSAGANEVRGPYFGHSREEELQEQACVAALSRARRLAEALARAQGLKVSRLVKVNTTRGLIPRRPLETRRLKAAAPAPTTPIEVGEEEIRATLTAVFELTP
jgi:uncharacterized protein YggE